MAGKTGPDEVWKLLMEMIKRREHLNADFEQRFKKFSEGMEELRKSQKEGMEELRESQKETDRQLRESKKEVDQQLKETSEQLKKAESLFNGQWSKLMESLVEGDLINLLQKRDIQVNYVLPRVHGIHEGARWEIDLLALNGEEVVVVEVKTTLKVDHVRGFLEGNLANIKTYFPDCAKRKIYGAIAYLRAEENVQTFAQRRGLFVIRATGSSASIINADSFKPKLF